MSNSADCVEQNTLLKRCIEEKILIRRFWLGLALALSLTEDADRKTLQADARKHSNEMLKFAQDNPLQMLMMADRNGHSIINKVVREESERLQRESDEAHENRLKKKHRIGFFSHASGIPVNEPFMESLSLRSSIY